MARALAHCFSTKRFRSLLAFGAVLCAYLLINYSSPSLLPKAVRLPATCARAYAISSITGAAATGPILQQTQHETVTSQQETPRYRFPDLMPRNYENFNDFSWIPRQLTQDLHLQAITLLDELGKLFRQNNVTYILCHGSLLGSYFFHDIIPWDDDIDIAIAFKDINKVRKLLRQRDVASVYEARSFEDRVNSFGEEYLDLDVDLEQPGKCSFTAALNNESCIYKFHFYRKDSLKTFRRPDVRYPYIDIDFFTENSTHITLFDSRKGRDFPLGDFYPLQQRPMFNLWQPAPKNSRKFLRQFFPTFSCSTKWYSHLTQTVAIGHSVDCDDVRGCYPYVRRFPVCDSAAVSCREGLSTLEQLRVGSTIIQEFVSNESFVYKAHSFEL